MSNIPQLDFERVNLLIELALAEDLADAGDTTSKSVIPADARARGVLYAKSDCVIAGLPVAEAVFKKLDPDCEFIYMLRDGDKCPAKTVIAEMRKRGLIYARTVGRRGAVFSLPGDFMKWSAQGHHGNNIDMLADKYLAYKPQKMSVLLVWGHSYEFPKADNWNVIEKFCEKMSRKKDIYYATMGEIALYVTAGRNLKISSDGKKLENPTKEKIFFVRNGKNLVLEAGKSYSF